MTEATPPEPTEPTPAEPDTTAIYLAKYMIGQRGFRPGTVLEAKPLADAADIVVTRADGMNLQILCILDRERDPSRTFTLGRDAIVDVAKQCLHYTGKMNGTHLPVIVQIWWVGPNVADAHAAREAVTRRWPGRAKVVITAWAFDTTAGTVTTTTRWGGLFEGRARLEQLLRSPRRPDHELAPVEPAALSPESTPWLTYTMLAVLALVFAGEHVFAVAPWHGDLAPDILTLAALGGLHHSLVDDGQWYRLFTCAVLHGSVFHLLLNGFALMLGGVILERLFGRAWLLALFMLGALGGSLFSYWLNGPEIISVGASGAIMGLLSAAFISSFRLPEGPDRTQIQMQLVQVLVPSLLPLAMAIGGKIDYAAHLGGAIAGALLGLVLLRTWPRTDPLPRLRGLALGLGLSGLAVLLYGASEVATTRGEYEAAATAREFLEHLIPDDELPKDDPDMFARAESLAAKYPRDPRARLANAYRLAEADNLDAAIAELRVALAEPEILAALTPDRVLEIELRRLLAQIHLFQGKQSEAREAAAPVCAAGPDNTTPDPLRPLSVCP